MQSKVEIKEVVAALRGLVKDVSSEDMITKLVLLKVASRIEKTDKTLKKGN